MTFKQSFEGLIRIPQADERENAVPGRCWSRRRPWALKGTAGGPMAGVVWARSEAVIFIVLTSLLSITSSQTRAFLRFPRTTIMVMQQKFIEHLQCDKHCFRLHKDIIANKTGKKKPAVGLKHYSFNLSFYSFCLDSGIFWNVGICSLFNPSPPLLRWLLMERPVSLKTKLDGYDLNHYM